MNIGAGRISNAITDFTIRHDEDVEEVLERLDTARDKLKEMRAEHTAFLRRINAKPPTPTPLQSAVQTGADWTEVASVVATTAYVAAGIFAKGAALNPYLGAAILGHQVFDSLGGYEWIKNKAVQHLGVEEQTALTATAVVRSTVHALSIFQSLKGAYSALTQTAAQAVPAASQGILGAFQQGLARNVLKVPGMSYLASGAQGAYSWTMTKVNETAMRAMLAMTGAVGFISQGRMLKAQHETSKGQWREAEYTEISQKLKEAGEAVSSLSKRLKGLESERKRLDDTFSKMAEHTFIDLAMGG